MVWKIHKVAILSQDCLSYYPAMLGVQIPVPPRAACRYTYSLVYVDNTAKAQSSLTVFALRSLHFLGWHYLWPNASSKLYILKTGNCFLFTLYSCLESCA